jgi:hypothetical protein
MKSDRPTNESDTDQFEARRRFLKDCGRYAVATPPAITLLLSTAGPNYAMAASGRGAARGEVDEDRRRGRNAHIQSQAGEAGEGHHGGEGHGK